MSPSRRTILKSSTGLVTGIGFLSTASAETDDKVAPGEVGLEDEIKELSKKNEVKEIKRLIEKHDLKASVTEASIHPDDGTDDDDISTDAYMRKDESSVSVTVIKNVYSSGYYVSGTADLKDQRSYWSYRKNGARANDGILLYWDGSEMTSRDGAVQENANYSAYPTENASSDTEITAIYDEYRAQYVGADVDIDPRSDSRIPDFSVNIATDLEVVGDHPYVSMEYVHRYTRTGSWIDLEPGYGGFNVTLNEDNHWNLDTTNNDFA